MMRIIWGVDESYAGAVVLGAWAAIGSTYNYAAPIYLQIRKDVERADFEAARAGMARVCRIVDILFRYGGVAAGKAMMAYHGIDAGDVRLPLKALSAAEKKAIVAELGEILGS